MPRSRPETHAEVSPSSNPTPLLQTVIPLLVAPLPALVMVAAEYVLRSGPVDPFFVFILPIVAAFCYASELLMVVPLFLIWPSLREPPLGVAAVWGLLVAWGTVALLVGFGLPEPNMELRAAASLSISGIASGLTYAVAVRRFPSQRRSQS